MAQSESLATNFKSVHDTIKKIKSIIKDHRKITEIPNYVQNVSDCEKISFLCLSLEKQSNPALKCIFLLFCHLSILLILV